MSVQKAIAGEDHRQVLSASRDRLYTAMVQTAADPDALGLVAQVAAQLLKVCEQMYLEQYLDEETYVADLTAMAESLATVLDTGSPSVLAQSSGVLLKVEGQLEQIRLTKSSQNDVDSILDRKPAADALVPARRSRQL